MLGERCAATSLAGQPRAVSNWVTRSSGAKPGSRASADKARQRHGWPNIDWVMLRMAVIFAMCSAPRRQRGRALAQPDAPRGAHDRLIMSLGSWLSRPASRRRRALCAAMENRCAICAQNRARAVAARRCSPATADTASLPGRYRRDHGEDFNAAAATRPAGFGLPERSGRLTPGSESVHEQDWSFLLKSRHLRSGCAHLLGWRRCSSGC